MKLKITIGNETKECDILYTFKSDNTNNNYLICTDNTYNDDRLNVFSFIYYPESKEKGLEKIIKEDDWREIEKFISIVEVTNND